MTNRNREVAHRRRADMANSISHERDPFSQIAESYLPAPDVSGGVVGYAMGAYPTGERRRRTRDDRPHGTGRTIGNGQTIDDIYHEEESACPHRL